MKGDRRSPTIAATRQQTRDLFAAMEDAELAGVVAAHVRNTDAIEPGLHRAITAELKAEIARRKAAQEARIPA